MLADKLWVLIFPNSQKDRKPGGPKTFGGGVYNPSYILRVIVETTVSDETAFHANWLVAKSPCFYILPDCGVLG